MNHYRLLQQNGLISYRHHRTSWLARRHGRERKAMLRLWDACQSGKDVERVLRWYRTHGLCDYKTSGRNYSLPLVVVKRREAARRGGC